MVCNRGAKGNSSTPRSMVAVVKTFRLRQPRATLAVSSLCLNATLIGFAVLFGIHGHKNLPDWMLLAKDKGGEIQGFY